MSLFSDLFSNALNFTWQQGLMILIGCVLIFLAIRREMEPSLLLPMGFGAILVNLPFVNTEAIETLFHAGIASELFPLLFPSEFDAKWLRAMDARTLTRLRTVLFRAAPGAPPPNVTDYAMRAVMDAMMFAITQICAIGHSTAVRMRMSCSTAIGLASSVPTWRSR